MAESQDEDKPSSSTTDNSGGSSWASWGAWGQSWIDTAKEKSAQTMEMVKEKSAQTMETVKEKSAQTMEMVKKDLNEFVDVIQGMILTMLTRSSVFFWLKNIIHVTLSESVKICITNINLNTVFSSG